MAEGTFKGTTYEIEVGLISNPKVKLLMSELAKNKSIELDVLYSPEYGMRYEYGLTKDQIANKYLLKILKTFLFLNGPAIVCLVLYVYYRRKIKSLTK